MTKKLILDLDTGIDDALAIAYALGVVLVELVSCPWVLKSFEDRLGLLAVLPRCLDAQARVSRHPVLEHPEVGLLRFPAVGGQENRGPLLPFPAPAPQISPHHSSLLGDSRAQDVAGEQPEKVDVGQCAESAGEVALLLVIAWTRVEVGQREHLAGAAVLLAEPDLAGLEQARR